MMSYWSQRSPHRWYSLSQLTSRSSPGACVFFENAMKRAAYFACIGVPSTAFCIAFSRARLEDQHQFSRRHKLDLPILRHSLRISPTYRRQPLQRHLRQPLILLVPHDNDQLGDVRLVHRWTFLREQPEQPVRYRRQPFCLVRGRAFGPLKTFD